MNETKKFKTETKRLLNLMINSIYTNKEIFLRELIANASDAIDKYHFLSLTDDKIEKRNDYKIKLSFDKDERTISIEDNGIGLTKDEIINNLGTIAKSGSKEFQELMEKKKEENNIEAMDEMDEREIIGQFGVGFYSSYLVAEKVDVVTKSPYDEKSWKFSSDGIETYTIEEADKENVGTIITLYLRNNSEDNNYDEYLDVYTLKALVKKYSDYIRYPIEMTVSHNEPKKDADGNEIEGETETVYVDETLNSMMPIWKKAKKDVTDEEFNEFYKSKFYDYQDPLTHLQYNVEGNVTYQSLLFIPKKAPYDLYSDKYEKGLQLYTKGVFIMDKCKDLIPDYLRFVKGIVDTSDLSLNISREMLQQNSILEKIQTNLEKKVVKHLSNMQNEEKEKYNEFFENFGINIKFGIYNSYGEKNDLLKDLLMFKTIKSDEYISLKDYCLNMKEDQKDIYFISAPNKEAVLSMPQMDAIKKKDYDVLILTENVDEFTLTILKKYDEHEFKSVNQGDLDLLTDEEKEEIKNQTEKNSGLLEKIKNALNTKVKDVRISKRLTSSPVCLVSGDGVSFEMEKILNSMPNATEANKVQAERILELNPNHPIFNVLEKIQDDEEKLHDYASILYEQSLLLEGFKVENPSELITKMCNIMIDATK